MRSYRDSKGLLWVSCSECERGGNGSDVDKCASGWKVKRWNGLGCFIGTLMSKFSPPKSKEVVDNSASCNTTKVATVK